jgi:molybdenum-dependent DNA-binding transcriptional regulator ModE
MNSTDVSLTYPKVKTAIKTGGSIRAASKLLGISYTALQWWLARNGLQIEKRAVLVRIKNKL